MTVEYENVMSELETLHECTEDLAQEVSTLWNSMFVINVCMSIYQSSIIELYMSQIFVQWKSLRSLKSLEKI